MFFPFSQHFLVTLCSHTETSGHHKQASGIKKIILGAFSSSKNITAFMFPIILFMTSFQTGTSLKDLYNLLRILGVKVQDSTFLDFPKCIWIFQSVFGYVLLSISIDSILGERVWPRSSGILEAAYTSS